MFMVDGNIFMNVLNVSILNEEYDHQQCYHDWQFMDLYAGQKRAIPCYVDI